MKRAAIGAWLRWCGLALMGGGALLMFFYAVLVVRQVIDLQAGPTLGTPIHLPLMRTISTALVLLIVGLAGLLTARIEGLGWDPAGWRAGHAGRIRSLGVRRGRELPAHCRTVVVASTAVPGAGGSRLARVRARRVPITCSAKWRGGAGGFVRCARHDSARQPGDRQRELIDRLRRRPRGGVHSHAAVRPRLGIAWLRSVSALPGWIISSRLSKRDYCRHALP